MISRPPVRCNWVRAGCTYTVCVETFFCVQSVTPTFYPTLISPSPVCTPDDRNLPPLNRIGNPDDILAFIRVEGGKVHLSSITLVRRFLADSKDSRATQILAETYQATPSYRVCTVHGVTQLTEGYSNDLCSCVKV